MTEQEIIDRINRGEPFRGLSNIRLLGNVEPQPKGIDQSVRPDLAMSIGFNNIPIQIYGTIKTQVTPKILEEIGPWLARLNENNPDIRYVLICPFLSPESQEYCQKNRVDFIDLCGNILIRIPGKVLIQQLNQPNLFKTPQLLRDPFWGASSRVLRVLLQNPNITWTIGAIYKELEAETIRQKIGIPFNLSLSSISKTIQSLEERLFIRREGLGIIVPERTLLILHWADEYQERYKVMRRDYWTGKNPFGFDIKTSLNGLSSRFPGLLAVVTGTPAANLIAPFADVDRIDMLVLPNLEEKDLRVLNNEKSVGPDFLFMPPYDIGAFMYARKTDGLPVAADIQTYLDCYARGGRDAKQAEHLLNEVIEYKWAKKND